MSLYSFIVIFTVFAYLADASPSGTGKMSEVNENGYSSVVSIGWKDQECLSSHFCSGILISNKHVLTAAHCIENSNKEHVEIFAGSNDLRSVDVQRFGIESWLSYKDWALENDQNFNDAVNDIAVIKLDVEDTNIPYVPILYVRAKKLNEAPVVLAGWGVTNKENNDPTMQKLSQFVLPKNECIKRIEGGYSHLKAFFGHGGLICTYTKPVKTFTSSCGFSGGPIFYQDKMVVAIHIGICPRNDPRSVSVEAYLNYHKDFILYAIQDD